MKRAFIVLMALAVLVALALPAGAAREGNKPDKPKPNPPHVGVEFEANLLWTNAPEDKIFYTLKITKPAGYTIDAITTEINGDGELSNLVEEEPGTYTYTQQYTVEGAFNPPDDWTGDLALDELVNTATVTFLNDQNEVVAATDSTSVTVEPIKPCPEGIDSGDWMDYDGGFCYHAFTPGYWTIESEPEGRKPLALTMRDHVPGNWCMIDEESQGPGRPVPPLKRNVNLPPVPDDWMDQGVCELGGRGVCSDESCYFPAGNPVNFVFAAAEGMVKVTPLTLPPSDQP